jgi:hypothetical protein
MSNLRSLLDGSGIIDNETARELAVHVGGSAEFWLRRQANYEDALDRAVERAAAEDADEWLGKIPAPGSLASGRISDRNRQQELRRRIAFYNVPNLRTWDARYGNVAETRFRTSPAFRSERAAVIGWLRQGELEAELIPAHVWSADKLKKALPEIRDLCTISHPGRFLPKLKDVLAACGVALVIMPAPRGCHASGAARMVAPKKAMILLSFRHRSDDQFWFTLFHEIGHLLLHTDRAFLDEDETPDSPAERQANKFASDCIVPSDKRFALKKLTASRNSITRFAVKVGVSPGLIVGQLQHEGIIPFGRMEFLKRRWTWDEIRSADQPL